MHRLALRRLTVAALLATLVAVAVPNVSLAADANPVNLPEHSTGTVFVVSAWWITLLAGTVIPLINGLLSRWTTSSGVKAVLTLVYNAVVALLTTGLAEDGTKVLSGQLVMTWFLGVVASIAAYYGVWKPNGFTSSSYKPHAADAPQPGKLANVGLK